MPSGSSSTRSGPNCIQPSSVDLHVDRYFRLFRNHSMRVIDVREDLEDLTELVEIPDGRGRSSSTPVSSSWVRPSSGSACPTTWSPAWRASPRWDVWAFSSTPRPVSSTPGWDGHLTLELSNVANLPITVYPGMKIGQISFLRMTTPADQPYGTAGLGSKYQGQRGPTPSRYFENFRP